MKHVVIVGGGFAGLNCARKLAEHPEIRITLIDKNNYQQFQPLLYQVAAGFLAPSNVAFSLRNMLVRHPNVEVTMDEVVSADLNTRTVTTAHGKTYHGDYPGAGCGIAGQLLRHAWRRPVQLSAVLAARRRVAALAEFSPCWRPPTATSR